MHFELLSRLMHVFWRLSRGQKVEVWVLALDDGGRIFLAEREDGWGLPKATIPAGESGLSVARRILAAHGTEPGCPAPALCGLHRAPEDREADHVALYLARDVTFAGDRPANTGRFFPPDGLPDTVPATTRQLITGALRA